MRRLYVDLDGVLADFDGGYEQAFGQRPDRTKGDLPGMWENVRASGLYANLPMMPGAAALWAQLKSIDPRATILTGVPRSVPEAAMQKIAWVRQHVGDGIPVICCASKDKSLYANLGDVLLDDWAKYRHLWERAGGTFVLHSPGYHSLSLQAVAVAMEAGTR